MTEQFNRVPQEMKDKFLDAFLHGEMLFCEFSFPRSVSVSSEEAVDKVVKCLRRCAKKTGVSFRIIPTGNLSRTDKQIHFHLIVLPIDADTNGIERLKDALQKRWAFVANRKHQPTLSTLQQGYSLVSTQEEYSRRLDVDGVENSSFETTAFKWAYNLDHTENDWLFCEDKRLGLDIVYSKHKKFHQSV